MTDHDPVERPRHYMLPCGTEVIEITKHLPFCLGSAVKYALRADHKGDPITDLRKAIKMLKFEIERREQDAARATAAAVEHYNAWDAKRHADSDAGQSAPTPQFVVESASYPCFCCGREFPSLIQLDLHRSVRT